MVIRVALAVMFVLLYVDTARITPEECVGNSGVYLHDNKVCVSQRQAVAYVKHWNSWGGW